MTRKHIHKPDIAVVTGFGDTDDMMEELRESLRQQLAPRSYEVIMSVPRSQASFHPDTFIHGACQKIEAMEADELVLIGYSYGALLALSAACRMEFKRVSHLFLIDGPLRSDIIVPPIRAFEEFGIHYECREQIARECEAVLAGSDHPSVIALGSRPDDIVPPEAKFLVGDQFQSVDYDPLSFHTFEEDASYNIVYKRGKEGHQLYGRNVIIATDIIMTAIGATTSASTLQP